MANLEAKSFELPLDKKVYYAAFLIKVSSTAEIVYSQSVKKISDHPPWSWNSLSAFSSCELTEAIDPDCW